MPDSYEIFRLYIHPWISELLTAENIISTNNTFLALGVRLGQTEEREAS